MAAARLSKPAHQHRVAGLEEDHQRLDAARGEHAPGPGNGRCRVTDADVQHERGVSVAIRVRVAQFEEGVQQVRRQVVDAGVAEVLEQLRRLALAGS